MKKKNENGEFKQSPIEIPDENGMVTDVITDAQYITNICRDYKITVDGLAEHLGFPISYLRNVEQGVRLINVELKKALLEFLKHRIKYE